MDKIVECVPNFSDGKNPEVHKAIGEAISSVAGVKLLDVDPDESYNRVVVTFVGSPDNVVEAAFRATKVAYDMIDMSKHQGEHPRFGAIDVCPFVPVRGVTMKDCIALSKEYGKRVGEELQVPVYLYEQSASTPKRKNLAKVRRGEYEALPEKLKKPEWKPDFGPAEFVPHFGAVATGARFFLVAYNINVDTSEVEKTHDLALTLRQMGKPKKKDGKIVRNKKGKKVFIPGKLRLCKAMGVPIEDGKRTQISMNLNNYLITPPHIAYEEALHEAAKRGLTITGSEIVGLVPLAPVLMAAHFYLHKNELDYEGQSEEEMVKIAEKYLGLSDYKKFEPQKKIIEFAIKS
ncbi:MAG: glutamate formimidoyltransferase [Deltaproteobacteria bacterium]|jgi:glutamate formiminotransferase/formiminotetrahydrofolate cyclodeaminase|nr:glutamate formimidoyltransferase [Deltaproteobacteria bacterium]